LGSHNADLSPSDGFRAPTDLRNSLVSTLLYLYASLLVPSFAHLFLTLGSANANFLYAAGLVWSLGGIAAWLDWAWAGGRLRWEIEREAGLVESDENEASEEGEEKEQEGGKEGGDAMRRRGWKRAILHS
jgi:predicted membrane channel-forming protein YqfA (hemolysin III family)